MIVSTNFYKIAKSILKRKRTLSNEDKAELIWKINNRILLTKVFLFIALAYALAYSIAFVMVGIIAQF
jgi:hypothetical protein